MKNLLCPVRMIFVLILCCWDLVQAQFNPHREPPGPSSRKTGLVITEIMYNPKPIPGLDTNLTLEFIELYNSQPWEEDLSEFFLDGVITYAFPSGTRLGAAEYLVVARVPDLVQNTYGLEGVFGPWDGASTNRLSTERGLIRLRNGQGAVLLSVEYRDSPPWPEGADGTGHSLCLARPSFGEADSRAWAQSDRVGGSPGGPDPMTSDPLDSVLINEWQNHSDPVDWLELYNHSNEPVDMSGAWLSDDPATNKFRIPGGITIPARGFLYYDQNQLGFELFAGGETIFLVNSNQTRVIDVVDFRGQSNNVSSGRSPDGGPIHYGLASRTQAAPNSEPIQYAVVISEIMYNPISGDGDEEYIEIHNRSSRSVSLAGWEFVVGISYTFPTNSITVSMPPGAYWVVASNPTNLFSIYPHLNTNNTFGPYDGSLANGGERVLLAAADYDRVTGGGVEIIERLNVPVSELIYTDGGLWGHWSDGQGSSLELIDPQSEAYHPGNWADSSDVSESPWTAIEVEAPLGETLGEPVNDRLIIMLQGIGECLLDEIEVRVGQGPNRVPNGGFEEDLSGWSLQGSHDFSTVEPAGFAGGKSLHLRAGSRGDNQSNRILSAPFAAPIPAGAGKVTFRAKAKWLRGHPEILLRLHGSATEAYGRMALPRRLGSPGQPNSRTVPHAGPAVYDARVAPVLPAENQEVVVTARASDPHGVALVRLRYRIDPSPAFVDITMLDDGAGADAVAADGVYSGVIPGQAAGVMAAFHIEARDGQNAAGTFPKEVFPAPGFTRCWPNDAVARECVVRWGEVQMPGDFASYHLWVTSANSNRWHSRSTQNNTPLDGTFVYNDSRVIYQALPLFSGSPWHRTNAITGPAGAHRVDYEMNFPDDDPLLGATDFVLNNPGNPDILTISDLSAVAEQTVYEIFSGMGMPFNHRRYVHMFVNGSQRSTAHERSGSFIFEDSQQPNGDMIEQWFPDDAGGQLFKVEDWFEFDENGHDVTAHNDADLTRRTVLIDGQPQLYPAAYRFMFRLRSIGVGGSANAFSELFALIDAASPPENPDSATVDPVLFSTVADWEEWMRHFAVQRAVGNWDSYGWDRGKNDYLYRSASGFRHMPWDIDYSLGLGRPADAPLFECNDPRVAAMFNTPEIVRAYWRAFDELVAGPFSNEYLDGSIDARAGALVANGVNIDLNAVESIKAYIGQRRAFLQNQLAGIAAPFAVEGPISFSTTNNLVVLQGTAPVNIKTIALNGTPYPVQWTTVSNFILRLVLNPGANEIVLQGLDRFGEPVEAVNLNLEYTGPITDPAGALVIHEIMALASSPARQFIEIRNVSASNFDLSGWRIEGAGFTFPLGSILTNGQIAVLARSRDGFRDAYGNVPIFGLFNPILSAQEQTLRLIKPGAMEDEIVDAVRYEARLPWPVAEAGHSLQLVDAAQDNSRASNWAVDPDMGATPGEPNSVAAVLSPYDPLWLNEVQIESLTGPLDNLGEAEPWIELYNAGAAPLALDAYALGEDLSGGPPHWFFPPGTVIEPGEFKVIWADGESGETTEAEPHADFRLGHQGTLALVRMQGMEAHVTDYLVWNLPRVNVSYGDYFDGQPITRFTLHDPTPGSPNVRRPLAVMINEWMARNDAAIRDPADQSFEDWFELYNAEEFPVDLGGYYLTDDLGDPTQFLIPDNGQYQIPPGGYLLVWADNEPSQNRPDRMDLHAGFALGGSAGAIALVAPDGATLIDALEYGDQIADVSEGRFGDGAHARYFMTRDTPRGPNSIAEYNTAPAFPVVGDQLVQPGEVFLINVRAVDPDGQMLVYTLEEGPPGTAITQAGTLRWVVPSDQPPGSYAVRIHVLDDGAPPRSATLSLNLVVPMPGGPVDPVDPVGPVIGRITRAEGQVSFTIETEPGRVYRGFYKDDLNAEAWVQWRPDFVAANLTASLTDTITGGHGFYRVERVD